MRETWIIPSYRYNKDTKLGKLLHQFLNDNDGDRIGFVQTLGTSQDQVDRWLRSEFTVGLTSRFKAPFEALTGIELERLYVLDAKHQILAWLPKLDALRRTNPGLARLLILNPELARKIDFDALTTRNEIIEALGQLAKKAGWPLVALQIGVEDRQVSKWTPNGSHRPSGEYLARAVTGLTMGLIATDPDDTRFQVTAQALLGRNFAELLGVSSLAQAANLIFEGRRDEPISVLSNRTGLDEWVVRSLLEYRPTGKRQYPTMIGVIRTILSRRYAERLTEFDSLTHAFLKNVDAGEITIEPLKLERHAASPASEQDSSTKQVTTPPRVHPALVQAQPPSVARSVPAQVSVHEALVRSVAAILLASRASIDGQLIGLQVQFPWLTLDATLPALAPPPRDMIEELLVHGTAPLSPNQVELVVGRFVEMVQLARMVCQIPEDQRSTLLGRLDKPLVQLQQILEAAGTAEPEQYLEMLKHSRYGGELLKG